MKHLKRLLTGAGILLCMAAGVFSLAAILMFSSFVWSYLPGIIMGIVFICIMAALAYTIGQDLEQQERKRK